jgi:hypothetical protein
MDIPQFVLEINTRVALRRLGGGRPLSINEIPDSLIEEWASLGFDAIWLMGIWMPSEGSRRIALELQDLRDEYSRAVPDWTDQDVASSPYAISDYRINPELGDERRLADLRSRLAARGLQLLLDFVPNHMAVDHPWIADHPERFVLGTEADVVQRPDRWFWAQTVEGPRAVAHGRDLYFPPWTDSAQLDYFNPELQDQMLAVLKKLAGMCDGVRCDMAMLELPFIFEQIWARRPADFWPRAIEETHRVNPNFHFIAEVYWGLNNVLEEQGFAVTYDKELLDLIVSGAPLQRAQFLQPQAIYRKRVRFLENHDEARIASRLPAAKAQAAAAWMFSLPGTRLLYEGQLDGALVKLPTQLLRAPQEPVDRPTRKFYETLLPALKHPAVRDGHWKLLTPGPAWVGNDSWRSILGQGYNYQDHHIRMFVNWSDTRSQCWVDLEWPESLAGLDVLLHDLVGPKEYVRNGLELRMRGLYLDLEPWEAHIFDCSARLEATVGDN